MESTTLPNSRPAQNAIEIPSSAVTPSPIAMNEVMQLPPSVILTSFTLFAKLPLELQLMIWRSMFPGPREIAFFLRQPKLHDRSTPQLNRCAVGSFALNPITLQICHQSRVETLKEYKILFQLPNAIYISPAIDTFDFSHITFAKLSQIRNAMTEEGRPLVKNVGIPVFGEDSYTYPSLQSRNRAILEERLNELFEMYTGMEVLTISWFDCLALSDSTREEMRGEPAKLLARLVLLGQQYKLNHPEWSQPELVMKEHWRDKIFLSLFSLLRHNRG